MFIELDKMIHLITYDLNKPGQDYSDLYEKIKSLGAWWHYLDSTWLVDTNQSASQIWENLKSCVDDNDNVLIIRITSDYKGWLPKKAWDWLNEQRAHAYSFCILLD